MERDPKTDVQADVLAGGGAATLGGLRTRIAAAARARQQSLESIEERLGATLADLAIKLEAEAEAERADDRARCLLEHKTLEARAAELDHDRQALAAERELLLAEVQRLTAEAEAERKSLHERSKKSRRRASRLDRREEELSQLAAQLAAREQELTEEAAEAEQRNRLSRDQLEQAVAQERDTLKEQLTQAKGELAQTKETLAKLRQAEGERSRTLAETASKSRDALRKAEQRAEEQEQNAKRLADELATLRAEAAQAQAAADLALADTIQERDRLAAEVAQLNATCAELKDQAQTENPAAEAERLDMSAALAALRAEHESQSAEWSEERLTLLCEREELTNALRSSLEALEAAPTLQDQALWSEKFELAQQDASELRRRVAELERDAAESRDPLGLASRELEDLRAERDDLLRLVARHESSEGLSEEPSQEMEDLRRRFEMAVEDLRTLKAENAELQSRGSSGAHTSTGDDWESQKRRLLASLEADGEPSQPERRSERASIEGTIRITDEAIAAKDREIAALLQRLEEQPQSAPPVSTVAVDSDQQVLEERERCALLRQSLESKLREAELELSVERARIAREQAELAEWRIELESLAEANKKQPGKTEGKRSRNWLLKMGLGGDSTEG